MGNPTDVVWKRVGQYAIDALIFLVPAWILYALFIVIFRNALGALLGVLFLLAGAAGFVYNYCVLPVQKGTGQTIGMRMLGLKMIKEDGTQLGYGGTFLRWILLIVDGLFCYLVGLILMLVDNERHQRLGDKVAKTVVVDEAYAGAGFAPSGYPAAGGYAPPAQPGYPPAQPGYAPPQPGYPQQPPMQPGYPPQQPGYPPQQPPQPPPGYPPQPPS